MKNTADTEFLKPGPCDRRGVALTTATVLERLRLLSWTVRLRRERDSTNDSGSGDIGLRSGGDLRPALTASCLTRLPESSSELGYMHNCSMDKYCLARKRDKSEENDSCGLWEKRKRL